MKEYKSDTLRNVAIISHGGAGKTTLAESFLFNTGATTRLGRVDDGTTITDFEPEEIKRKVTISTALAPCEWQGHKINFLDTPGYADFVGEVKGSLRAVESALVVVCAASGVEVDTEKVWRYTEELQLPRLVFINKMDRENADFYAALQEMKDRLSPNVVALQLPIGAEDSYSGIVDLLTNKAYSLVNGTWAESAIPDDMLATVEDYRQQLIEVSADGDDALLTKYLEGEELSTEEIQKGLLKGMRQAKLFPVFCGSAYKNIGIKNLMDEVLNYVPAPSTQTVLGTHPKTEDLLERTAQDPFAAIVFKTTADPFVGRLSYIKIFAGSIKPDTTLYNVVKEKAERIGGIFTLRGKQQEALTIANAGDIVVVAKLQETATGDTLCDKDHPILFEAIDFPQSMFTMCLEAKNKGDEDKIGNALHRLLDEDPTYKVRKNVETNQLLVSGMGELHLDIMAERMKRKFGVGINLKTPKVPYRETIRSSVKIEGKHKKQSGGHGQYGHVWLQLEPLSPGGQFEFVDAIFGGAVPRQYIPAVEKGVKDALHGGVLAGYPMVDVKVTLLDGSYHTVDSSEMAFKIASTMALRKGALQAKPVLLEPIASIQIQVPESNMGDIVADLNGKRGRIQGMEPNGKGMSIVKATAPMAELFRYAIDLRSLTQGRGSFNLEFSHYEEVPGRIAENIIASTKKDSVEEA